MEAGYERVKLGLVAMSRRRKRAGTLERRVGVQEHEDAGIRSVRESRSQSLDSGHH